MLTGQARFDVSQTSSYVYALRTPGAKSIVVELAPDGNAEYYGSVNVFLGQAVTAGPPWFPVMAKTLRVYPIPETDCITIIPSAGALGICTVSLSQEQLGVGIYPFDEASGGSGGGEGPQGPRGLTGAAGPAGAPGADGATGPAGAPGADGATGSAGAPGADGTIGATGPAGASSVLSYDPVILAESALLHYWPCNDAAGATSAADSVSGGTLLALTAANAVFGAAGSINDGETALQFLPEPSAHYLTIPTALYPVAPFSFEFLVSNLHMSLQPMPFDLGQSGGDRLMMYYDGTRWNFSVNGGSSAIINGSLGMAPIHVATTISTTVTTLFLNGVPIYSVTAIPTSYATYPFTIGSRFSDPTYNTNAKFSKIALYNAVLTQAKISAHVLAAGIR